MTAQPSKNRFEQVDALQADALNLLLVQTAAGQDGRVVIPASAQARAGAVDIDSGAMPARDAFRSAIRLANDMKLPIVVIDPSAIWQSAWGELYRDDQADEAVPSA